MRLWSEQIIEYLPRQQLLGQWRECIALLHGGWGKKHRIVDYAFKYDKNRLANFAFKVAIEMDKRGYKPNMDLIENEFKKEVLECPVYPEHNIQYLNECIQNLKGKGINIITI
jgi:uncharacterized protein (TIGR02328 family)